MQNSRGKNRPFNPILQRIEVLAELESVTYVFELPQTIREYAKSNDRTLIV